MENTTHERIDALPIHPAEKQRIKMSIQCKDSEYIPKVPQAGQTFEGENGRYQLMHNDVKVVEGGYLGLWTTELIKLLRGHHEPQEERAFHEILKFIPENSTMIELGSWWSYYSLWFQKEISGAKNYMIEPDPSYLEIGRKNFSLNGMSGNFLNAAIGKQTIEHAMVRCESDNVERPMPIITVDDFCDREGIDKVDLVLCDIQGYELEMLQGSARSIEKGMLRFVVISTHHHTISNDPLIHQKCLSFLQEHGAYILIEHTVSESYSGDGLIVASFTPADRSIPPIEISRNLSRNSLFRELEYDLADAFEERKKISLARDTFHSERDALIIERDTVHNALVQVYQSHSWRVTRPLRAVGDLIRILKYKVTPVLQKLLSHLKQIAKRQLQNALKFVWAHSWLKRLATKVLGRFPSVERRLKNIKLASSIILTRQTGTGGGSGKFESVDEIPNDQIHLTRPVLLPPSKGQRKIYFYVDHTILCPSNTGMQRVTRRLGRALMELGEDILFVKWDANTWNFTLVSQDELAYLAKWYGPITSQQVLDRYPKPGNGNIPVEQHELGAGHWLVVPEVPHITYQPQPMTLDILMGARRCGLMTAFIYYDATPLRQEYLRDMAVKHETYMQQLLLADLVIPISNWSARDLVSFLQVHEGAALTPTPRITALPLPGESQLAPRVTTPVQLSETNRFILSVGSIVPHKNQVSLVHAFERFCESHAQTDWQLTLVGNLHPDLAGEIKHAISQNSRIRYVDHIPDDELDKLYRSCAFTVFPSIEEGFGLPILESLWYGKPCVCANFGSMAEVGDGGGCFQIDTRNNDEMLRAISSLMMDPSLLEQLSQQAVRRSISTWDDYGKNFSKLLDSTGSPLNKLGSIYYWVDHTVTFNKNTGIQRVSRGLAHALLERGCKLIPVKWDEDNCCFYPPSKDELDHFAHWNGPDPSAWSPWIDPAQATANDWILVPELTSYLQRTNLSNVKTFANQHQLRLAGIFFDAIPFIMREMYPSEASYAHEQYMRGLNEFDLVMPISQSSRYDLISFLSATSLRTPALEDRIQASTLPGEFLESDRSTMVKRGTSSTIKILCVSTVEPRKNHLGLLRAFSQILQHTSKPIELIIAGDSPYSALAHEIQEYINKNPQITWEKNANDVRIGELYDQCDFTVYPSLEEGFGLPILESLWHARPCICNELGAIAEAAEGGGCIMVEMKDSDKLAEAMLQLVEDDVFRLELAEKAAARTFKTWADYAAEVSIRLATERYIPLNQGLPTSIRKSEFYNHFVNLTSRPLLSICISTYNRAEWLSVSLKNLARLLPNPRTEIEIVVCDNTSTDHTPDVVKPYLQRDDFRYYRNPENVGMLGNLRVTAHHANGQYIWILGDDDIVKPGSIEKVLQVIQKNPDTALIYLNYAYTHKDNPNAVIDLDKFLNDSTPVVTPNEDIKGLVKDICTESENFFTAIYCLVFRRDHALRAYSQNTDGRPFSTMLSCIPTTYYTLNFMMNEPAYWVGKPQLVVNLNVSWMKYAPLWILERIPEVYDLAERLGANPQSVDRWRTHTLPGIIHWFRKIYENDPEGNMKYFSPSRLLSRIKHLREYKDCVSDLQAIYETAYEAGHPGAKIPSSQLFLHEEKEY